MHADIDNYLKQIVKILQINSSFIDNLGLLNGKMGVAIFLYHYANYSQQNTFLKFAEESLYEVIDDIDENTTLDFASGLTGIGWGIEYLSQNRILEINTDEALEELDHTIHKGKLKSQSILEIDSLFGYGHYYLARIKNSENKNEIKTLVKRFQLISLVDECERFFIFKNYLEHNKPVLSLSTINSIIYFILEVFKLNLYPSKVNKLLFYLADYIVFLLNILKEKQEIVTLRYLVLKIIQLNKDKDIIQQYKNVLKEINCFETDIRQTSILQSFITTSWQSIIYKGVVNFNFSKAVNEFEVLNILNNDAEWKNVLNRLNKNSLGLAGLSGLGFGLLRHAEYLKKYKDHRNILLSP